MLFKFDWLSCRQWMASLWSDRLHCAEPYTTPEDRPFVDFLNSHPHDRTARLAYADWLEERERPLRASLIRAQVLSEKEEPGQALDLDLLLRQWLPTLPYLPGIRWVGFEQGSLLAQAQGLAALELLHEHPEVDCGVALTMTAEETESPRFVDLLDAGKLVRVRSATVIAPGLISSNLLRWLRSEHTRALHSLRLRVPGVSDRFTHELARQDAHPELDGIEVAFGRFSAAGIRSLLQGFPRLQKLAIRNPLSRLRLDHTADLGSLAALEDLTLENVFIQQEHSPISQVLGQCSRVRNLNLAGNGLTAAAVQSLLADQDAVPFATIDLSGNPIGDDGVAALVRSPRLRELQELNLRSTGLSDSGVFAITESGNLNSLKKLDLGSNGIHEEGFHSLCKWLMSNQVESLDLTKNLACLGKASHPCRRLRNRLFV